MVFDDILPTCKQCKANFYKKKIVLICLSALFFIGFVVFGILSVGGYEKSLKYKPSSYSLIEIAKSSGAVNFGLSISSLVLSVSLLTYTIVISNTYNKKHLVSGDRKCSN